jgi:hypothetical protein
MALGPDLRQWRDCYKILAESQPADKENLHLMVVHAMIDNFSDRERPGKVREGVI